MVLRGEIICLLLLTFYPIRIHRQYVLLHMNVWFFFINCGDLGSYLRPFIAQYVCICKWERLEEDLRTFFIVSKKINLKRRKCLLCDHNFNDIYVPNKYQGKLSAWQSWCHYSLILYLLYFSFSSYSLLYLNSKLPQSLFTTHGHLLVLRCQTVLLKRATASDPFVNIQIISAMILK